MFTIDQIKEAHARVRTAADFPQYVKELKKLGVTSYTTYVGNGHTDYNGINYSLQLRQRNEVLDVSDKSDVEKFRFFLKEHQDGRIDYSAFCKQSAKAGVERWTVDMEAMTCTYYNKSGVEMLVEKIPA